MVTVLLAPWIPGTAEKLLGAARHARRSASPVPVGAARRRGGELGRASPSSDAAVPQAACSRPETAVIDTHTHLDSCAPADAELVAAARARGRRPHPHGRAWTARPAARRCAPPRSSRRSTPRSAATPTTPTGFDDADLAELQALAAHERCAAIGETGLDFFRDYAPARRPGARVPRADRAGARDRQAAGHPHARGRGRHARHAARARAGPAGDPALLLDARPPRRVPGRGLVDLVRRQRHLPARPSDLAAAAERVPDDRLLVETDAPVPHAAGRAQGAQPAGLRRPHRALRRRAPRRRPTRSSSALVERNAAALFGW